ncbi:PEP-CTERM sorting domain-containing protein [Aquisphaera insulae]|uniref:PEP-CTERM sorting domain-containing protein n=1 Tax=Aquisphaera insulae TaxID=2712864 RepID=UPI0013EC598E|nr:PEP-CTERM sorting domain-containing protein [Aquisphaera insulae]
MLHLSMRRFAVPSLVALGFTLGSAMCSSAQAGSFVFVTPADATTSGPVSAEADFTTAEGKITIVLKNLQSNIGDVAQAISDIKFSVGSSSELIGAAVDSPASVGKEVTVASNKTYSVGSSAEADWNSSIVANSVHLDALGSGQPQHLIIGGPDSTTNKYAAAGGSIAGNGPHNPFLYESATFVITGDNITANTLIKDVSFSFGTKEGEHVIPSAAVPEPSSLLLGLAGIGLAGAVKFARRRQAA